jgi:hypothetical protein
MFRFFVTLGLAVISSQAFAQYHMSGGTVVHGTSHAASGYGLHSTYGQPVLGSLDHDGAQIVSVGGWQASDGHSMRSGPVSHGRPANTYRRTYSAPVRRWLGFPQIRQRSYRVYGVYGGNAAANCPSGG